MQFEKILLKYGLEKVPNWECLFVHSQKELFLSVYVDDIKLAGKKQNLDPMWKLINKEVDLEEPTSFLDHVYLGCTQRQCEISKDIVDNYRTMFESRISAGGAEKLPFPQNFRISSWSYDMESHAKKCMERYCELANKTTQQLYKVSTPCIHDHDFKDVNRKPPIQQNPMKNGYGENNDYNKSDETKCATNYSFISNNNKWNVNTHNNMHLTEHDTNDDIDFDNCVVHTVR